MATRAALVVFLGVLVWAPWPLGSNRAWAWTILELGIFLAAALWVIGWMRREVRDYGALPAAWPALAVFGAWILYLMLHWLPLPVAWVRLLSPESVAIHSLASGYDPDGGTWMTISIDPYSSFVFWLKSCAYGVAFFLTLALANTRERARLIAYVMVASGVLQALYGGLMHLSKQDLEIFGAQIHHSINASGGFTNRNHLAGCLEIALSIGIGLMIGSLQETGKRTWKQFWRDMAELMISPKAPLRLFLVAMVIALVMTHSRMGNSAFFSSLLIAGGTVLVLRRYATRSVVILVTSLIAVDIFIVGTWFGVEKTIDRLEQTTRKDVEERVEPSEYALEMLRHYPVFGAGAGTFYTAFNRFRSPDIRAYFDFAHNDFTQFLVETGFVGALLAGSLPVMALGCAVFALARRRDKLARGFAFGAIMGVSSIAMHSTVDFNLQIPANALAFCVLLAFAWIALYLDRSPGAASAEARDGSSRGSRSSAPAPSA